MQPFSSGPSDVDPERWSPARRRLAPRKPWRGRLNIFVRRTASSIGDDIRITDSEDRSIAWFVFGNETTLIYGKDRGGDENYHLYSVGVAGGAQRDLTPFPGVNARILDRLRGDPDHMLITMNRRDPSICSRRAATRAV